LTREVFAKQGLKQIPTTGPLSWSVPGCVAGWEDLRARLGTWSLARILEPAIRYAEDGFPVTEVIAADWKSSAAGLSRWPDSARTFLPGGDPPAVGEMFRNPDLAATYRAIAAGGVEAFYRGPIAQQIASFSKAHGGYFSLRDFAEHKNDWVDPVSTTYRGRTIYELPPNGQGIAALEMLNVLEGYDLRSMGANTHIRSLLGRSLALAFKKNRRAAFTTSRRSRPRTSFSMTESRPRKGERFYNSRLRLVCRFPACWARIIKTRQLTPSARTASTIVGAEKVARLMLVLVAFITPETPTIRLLISATAQIKPIRWRAEKAGSTARYCPNTTVRPIVFGCTCSIAISGFGSI
jgi:hypothetical protein